MTQIYVPKAFENLWEDVNPDFEGPIEVTEVNGTMGNNTFHLINNTYLSVCNMLPATFCICPFAALTPW